MPGYDNLKWCQGLLLDLQMKDATGAIKLDDSAIPHHPIAQTNTPSWVTLASGLQVLSFTSASLDYLQSPAGAGVADLDFTAGNFTLGMWMYPYSFTGADVLMCLGDVSVDGWELYTFETGTLNLRLHQGGSNKSAYGTGVTIDEWQFVIAVRAGPVGVIYRNGRNITTVTEVLANPVSVAGGNKLLIGCQSTEIDNFWNGMLWGIRIWNRAVTPEEVVGMFNYERWLFNV